MHGETYNNKQSFFAISVTKGWVQIPQETIKGIKEIKKSEYEYSDYLYKRNALGSLFDYPYYLIQVVKPPKF